MNYKKFVFPSKCPICNSTVIKDDDKVIYKCSGKDKCPEQVKNKLIHFASRLAVNIDGFGDELISNCFEKGYLKNIDDFYKLTKENLLKLDLVKEKKANNILQSIEKSKENIELHKFIYGLGINEVGESTSKILAKNFYSLENIMNLNYEELVNVEDIGPISAKNIIDFFNDKNNLELINSLNDLGVYPLVLENKNTEEAILGNMTFVLTGAFEEGKEYYKKQIENLGGKVSSSVSKKVDYVLYGEDAGQKLDKAKELNINLINSGEFIKLLEDLKNKKTKKLSI